MKKNGRARICKKEERSSRNEEHPAEIEEAADPPIDSRDS